MDARAGWCSGCVVVARAGNPDCCAPPGPPLARAVAKRCGIRAEPRRLGPCRAPLSHYATPWSSGPVRVRLAVATVLRRLPLSEDVLASRDATHGQDRRGPVSTGLHGTILGNNGCAIGDTPLTRTSTRGRCAAGVPRRDWERDVRRLCAAAGQDAIVGVHDCSANLVCSRFAND